MSSRPLFTPLARIVHRLALVIGVAVGLAVPSVFALSGYLNLADALRTSARLSADRLSQYAYIQGDSWQFSGHRVSELIRPLGEATHFPRQVVVDADGARIAGVDAPVAAPAMSSSWPIVVRGERAGSVLLETSLRPLLWLTGAMSILGAGLGVATYFTMHVLPLRALRRVSGQLEVVQGELATSHAKLSEAIEALPDAFALYDPQDRLVLFNRRYLEFYGLSAQTARLGPTFEQTLRQALRDGRFPAAAGCEEAWIAERVGRHRSFDGVLEQEVGDGRWLRVVERSTADGGRVGVSADISELKQTIAELQRSEVERNNLRDQFYHAQQMQALGTLAGGVAHDFNNLLAIMIGHAELLLDGVSGNPQLRLSVDEIIQAGERGADLVRQILLYTRREQAAMSPIRLDRLLAEELSLLRSTLPASVDLQLSTTPDATVRGNRTQLHQILVNLCVNANHAIGSRPGRIAIALTAVDVRSGDPATARVLTGDAVANVADGDLLVAGHGTLAPGRHWCVAVRDNGAGMTADVLARIFEPFFTTREVGAGAGLGLAAVSGIVTGMAGAITVRTAPGRGTVFEIYLPALAGEATTTDAPSAAAAAVGADRRVLLVDDEPGLLALAERNLRAAGYAVLGVDSSTAALRQFREAPDAFDLVVTDQAMPLLTGLDLARAMLELRPDLPIVMCTGFADSANQQAALALGIREVLLKPVRGAALVAAAARMVAPAGTAA